MIHRFDLFHGVVFARLLHESQDQVSIRTYPSQDNASYVLNNKIGIYIKYSSKRLSPWRFSFQKRHQDEILKMNEEIGNSFLILVCNDDGIIVLNFEELKQILDEIHKGVEWVSVNRNRREMYSIKGSDGKLKFKVSRDDFPKKLFLDNSKILTKTKI